MGKKVSEAIKAEEAENLARLFEAAGNPSYEAFSKAFGIAGGKAVISQHINKVRPISLEAAIGYATGFGKPLSEISLRLAEIVDRIPKTYYQPSTTRDPLIASEPTNKPLGELSAELAAHISKMNERGLILLIDKAEEIAARHPKQKREAA